ncbi:MAG: YceD family protein [Pseudomonadales bacterium]|nr:YceD family protein [Pseudomonadales bacterium]
MLAGQLPNKVNFCQYADSGALLEGIIPLDRFDRLINLVQKPYCEVSVSLGFHRGESKHVSATGTVQAEVRLICQSCLESMTFPIVCKVNVMLLESEDELLELAQHEEGILVEAPVARLTDILEDELILSLPMVSRHSGQCWDSDEYAADETDLGETAEVTTHRPFENLSSFINEKE